MKESPAPHHQPPDIRFSPWITKPSKNRIKTFRIFFRWCRSPGEFAAFVAWWGAIFDEFEQWREKDGRPGT